MPVLLTINHSSLLIIHCLFEVFLDFFEVDGRAGATAFSAAAFGCKTEVYQAGHVKGSRQKNEKDNEFLYHTLLTTLQRYKKFRGCFDFIVGSEKENFRVLARLLLSGIAALWREKEQKPGFEKLSLQPSEYSENSFLDTGPFPVLGNGIKHFLVNMAIAGNNLATKNVITAFGKLR